jgi:RHS repeat-associated protein
VDRVGSRPLGGQYKPCGVELGSTNNDAEKFATYYRDQKTGFDYAINRYYWSGLGRFLTPDPAEPAEPENPQSWNFYTYVLNDPTNFNDPEGLIPCGDIIVGLVGSQAPRLSAFLNTNTDIGLLAVTVFTESAMRNTAQGAEEMAAIASVIMNRYNIVNGYVGMVRENGSVQAPPRAWGAADRSLRTVVVNPTQFEVWQGPGDTLTPAAQGRLNAGLNADADSDLCQALLNATGTTNIALQAKNTGRAFVSETGLIYTGFNSFPEVRKYDWEQAIAQYGSANRFYGVRLPLPVPTPIRRDPRPRRPRDR